MKEQIAAVKHGNEYCRRGDEAIGDLRENGDDLLLLDEHFDTHVKSFRALLDRCQHHQITLNIGKLNFALERVNWTVFIISPRGYKANPAKLQAIIRFPSPTNIHEMRRFMGIEYGRATLG